MLTVGRVVNRHRRNMNFAASGWPPVAVLLIWRCTFPIRCSAVAQTSVRRLRHCPFQSSAYNLWFKSCRYPRLRHELDRWDSFGWERTFQPTTPATPKASFVICGLSIDASTDRSWTTFPAEGYTGICRPHSHIAPCGENAAEPASVHESGRVSVRTAALCHGPETAQPEFTYCFGIQVLK